MVFNNKFHNPHNQQQVQLMLQQMQASTELMLKQAELDRELRHTTHLTQQEQSKLEETPGQEDLLQDSLEQTGLEEQGHEDVSLIID